MMETLTGRPISPGYAQGIAVVYDSAGSITVPRYEIDEDGVDSELRRFQEALEESRAELRRLEQRALAELGQTYATIFSSHLALLHDHQFTQQVEQRVRGDLVNVEQALDTQVADLAHVLGSLENEYLRERAQDIRDLGTRLMRQLIQGDVPRYVRLAPRSVIVTRELLPSETINLDRQHVVGIVTEQGGENSHAAILARALGIPAVTAVDQATLRIKAESSVLVDGNEGYVILAPTEQAMTDLTSRKSDYEVATANAVDSERLECRTRDGVRIALLANLNRFEEADLVNEHQLDGVGLFRTEFLYMDSPQAPTYERQLHVYRQLLDVLGDHRLVVRTLDLGGDKLPMFLLPQHAANPNLVREFRRDLLNAGEP